MHATLPTPDQIRAGRALVGLSQDQLAARARVSAGTLRALEALRRPIDSDTARAVKDALEKAGVAFVASDAYAGPGVRWGRSDRPTLVRLPTVVTQWDGVPFEVDWQGKVLTAFVSREALMILGDLAAPVGDEQLLAVFEQHQARILDAAVDVMADRLHYDKLGRLHIRPADLGAPANTPLSLPEGALVQLDPLPKRFWRGVRQADQSEFFWRIEPYDPATRMTTIYNITTGHHVPLHSTHVRGMTAIPGSVHNGNGPEHTLHLRVQLVFEDGHVRVELL